jgi:predicted MPP superfamily phosphohydrolase
MQRLPKVKLRPQTSDAPFIADTGPPVALPLLRTGKSPPRIRQKNDSSRTACPGRVPLHFFLARVAERYRAIQMRILHLSDLHLQTASLRDQRIVLKALFYDIREDIKANGPIDLVFFTGDLIAKGAYTPDNMAAVITEFIDPLFAAANISGEQFFIVPGNHDVDLKSQSGILSAAQKLLTTNDEISKYLEEACQTLSPKTGLEGFTRLTTDVVKTQAVLENTHYRAYKVKIGLITVGIGALNSAWRATGSASDGDYGALIVGGKQLDEVISALDGCDLKLALMHHPVAWMSVKDSRYIHRQLLLHFDALFHGHNHEADAQTISGTSNNYFVSNAGCLYQSREYFNGYCVVSCDASAKEWEIRAREYIEVRQVFDKSLRFGPDGKIVFIRAARTALSTAPVLPSDEFIEALQESVNGHLLSALVSDVAPSTLRSIFVDPPISKVSTRQVTAEKINGKSTIFLPLKEVILSKRNVLFVGTKDMGKTTLMLHLCSLSLDFGQNDFPPFSVFVDLEIAGDTRAAILESIVAFGKGSYRRSEFLALLASGAVAVCFDNVRAIRTRQLKTVTEFCAEFGSCRFFFSTMEEVEYSLSPDKLPRLSSEMDVLYLHPFGRKETRQLTQKWYTETLSEATPKVDEVLSLLARLNIPRSPFLISALLWIREKQIQFSPVNQAEILDALIDGVMEKLSEKKDRSGLDSNIKRHFLASLAEHLHETKSRRITSHELDSFTVKYFGMKGLASTSGPFLEELKKKGILLEIGSDVTFMFDSIRAFFLSSRFQESQPLLEAALDPSNFLSFGEELDYFTGRHRDKREVLERVAVLVDKFRDAAGLNRDLALFDSIAVKESPLSGVGGAQDFDAAIAGRKPSDESREELLESIDEQTRSRSQNEIEEIRLRRLDGTIGKYLEALRIGSSILRNSELVDDLDLKKRVYSQFSQCWCEIMIAVLVSVESADENSQGLEVLRGFLPTENTRLAAYLLKMLAPNVIIALAVESMGTAKLRLVIENKLSEPITTVEGVISTFLSVDLDFPNRFQALSNLLDKHKKNRFVAELVFFKLMQLFFFARLDARDEATVRELLGDSVTSMLSIGTQVERNKIKSRLLAGLEKTKLLKHWG